MLICVFLGIFPCTLGSKTNSHKVVHTFFLIFFLILIGFVVMSPFPLVIVVILTIISESVKGYLSLSEIVVQLMLCFQSFLDNSC